MNPIVKEKWIKALRSGEYKQGRNQLKEGDCFCCLGVLTDLYAKEKGLTWGYQFMEGSEPVYGSAVLPHLRVLKWAGLKTANPLVAVPESIKGKTGRNCDSLAAMNDRGCTFDQIADVIEEQV